MPLPFIPGAESILIKALSPTSLCALNATSQHLRQQVHEHTRSLQLRSSDDVPLLIQHSWPSLRQLKFYEAQLSKVDLIRLAEGRFASLPALDHLAISQQLLHPDTLQTLAHHTWSSLTSLDLSSEGIGHPPDGALAVCCHLAASNLPQLRALSISGMVMTAPAMAQLVTRDWPMLCSLDLSGTRPDCQNITSVPVLELRAASWTSLRHLSLRHRMLGLDDVWHIQQANWPHLTNLDLYNCQHYSDYQEDWDPQVEALIVTWCRHVAAGKWPQLAVLDLGHNRFTAQGVAELAKGKWPALRKLSVSHSMDGFVVPLVSAPWTTLEELDLRSCQLTEHDMQHLQHAHWPWLSVLDFHSARFEMAEHDVVTSSNMWRLPQQHWPLVKLRTGLTSEFYSMAMTSWHALSWLDVTSSPLSPEQVVTLLQAHGHLLDTLHVHCIAGAATEARPKAEHWPANTCLSLEVNLDNAALQSLSLGHWPAFRMKCVSFTNCRQAADAMTHMLWFQISLLQELDMSCSFCDCCDCNQHMGYSAYRAQCNAHRPDMSAKPAALNLMLTGFQMFHLVSWDKLRWVNLSHNGLTEEFVSPLLASRWPRLQVLDLSDNKLGLNGVKQLVNAHWPLLTDLNVRRNAFNKSIICKQTKAALLRLFKSTWPLLCVLLDYDDGQATLDVWNCRNNDVDTSVVRMT